MNSDKSQFEVNHNNMPQVIGELRGELASITVFLKDFKEVLKLNNKEEYLSRKEVALLLKCDESTIHNWTVKGKLIKHCIGSRAYYKRSEVEKALVPIR